MTSSLEARLVCRSLTHGEQVVGIHRLQVGAHLTDPSLLIQAGDGCIAAAQGRARMPTPSAVHHHHIQDSGGFKAWCCLPASPSRLQGVGALLWVLDARVRGAVVEEAGLVHLKWGGWRTVCQAELGPEEWHCTKHCCMESPDVAHQVPGEDCGVIPVGPRACCLAGVGLYKGRAEQAPNTSTQNSQRRPRLYTLPFTVLVRLTINATAGKETLFDEHS
jgi:hypothetical protein